MERVFEVAEETEELVGEVVDLDLVLDVEGIIGRCQAMAVEVVLLRSGEGTVVVLRLLYCPEISSSNSQVHSPALNLTIATM